MQNITSSQNPVLKELKALKQKKVREEKQLFFIEGIRFVEEALKESADIDKIFLSDKLTQIKGGNEILERMQKGNYSMYSLPDRLFKEISDTENPQGILATVRFNKLNTSDIPACGDFYVVLDSLQDPGNMGTIIRTADAAGASGIIVSKGCVDIYNPKVLRSTMGSIFHVPVYNSEDMGEGIRQLKSMGVKVYAAHLEGALDYFEADMTGRCAVIIGNEAGGISSEIAGMADALVKIPMPGRAESLNASVAASLMMYEVVRLRSTGNKGGG